MGRVATRLKISTVVATGLDYSGSGAFAKVTLGLLPGQFPVSSFELSCQELETRNWKLALSHQLPASEKFTVIWVSTSTGTLFKT